MTEPKRPVVIYSRAAKAVEDPTVRASLVGDGVLLHVIADPTTDLSDETFERAVALAAEKGAVLATIDISHLASIDDVESRLTRIAEAGVTLRIHGSPSGTFGPSALHAVVEFAKARDAYASLVHGARIRKGLEKSTKVVGHPPRCECGHERYNSHESPPDVHRGRVGACRVCSCLAYRPRPKLDAPMPGLIT